MRDDEANPGEDFEPNFFNSYASFILKLKAKYCLAATTCQKILDDIGELFDLNQTHQKDKLNDILHAHGIEEEVVGEFSQVFDNDCFQLSREKPATECKQNQYFKDEFSFVEPATIELGIDNKGVKEISNMCPSLRI